MGHLQLYKESVKTFAGGPLIDSSTPDFAGEPT